MGEESQCSLWRWGRWHWQGLRSCGGSTGASNITPRTQNAKHVVLSSSAYGLIRVRAKNLRKVFWNWSIDKLMYHSWWIRKSRIVKTGCINVEVDHALVLIIEAAEVALPEESWGGFVAVNREFLNWSNPMPHLNRYRSGIPWNIELYHVRLVKYCIDFWEAFETDKEHLFLGSSGHLQCWKLTAGSTFPLVDLIPLLEETLSWGQSITRCFRKCGLGEQQLTTLMCLVASWDECKRGTYPKIPYLLMAPCFCFHWPPPFPAFVCYSLGGWQKFTNSLEKKTAGSFLLEVNTPVSRCPGSSSWTWWFLPLVSCQIWKVAFKNPGHFPVQRQGPETILSSVHGGKISKHDEGWKFWFLSNCQMFGYDMVHGMMEFRVAEFLGITACFSSFFMAQD